MGNRAIWIGVLPDCCDGARPGEPHIPLVSQVGSGRDQGCDSDRGGVLCVMHGRGLSPYCNSARRPSTHSPRPCAEAGRGTGAGTDAGAGVGTDDAGADVGAGAGTGASAGAGVSASFSPFLRPSLPCLHLLRPALLAHKVIATKNSDAKWHALAQLQLAVNALLAVSSSTPARAPCVREAPRRHH